MTDKARILVVTGPGKGKTTSALGVVLRCAARGKKTLLVRFTKAQFSGELAILSSFPGVTIVSGEYGMTPRPDHPEYPKHVAAARALFAQTVRQAHEYDAIIMDELCGVVARDMVHENEVVEFLHSLRPDQIAMLTGRGASLGLIAIADTVSTIECTKHGYTHGIHAQEGVEL